MPPGEGGGPVRLSDDEFELFRIVMERETGIVLKPSKRQLLENRLRPMLRLQGRRSFAELVEGVRDPEQRREVLAGIIDAVTTNLTRFFREAHQFETLRRECVPAMIRLVQAEQVRQVQIWSAGCSSGQEPWSIAMVLRESVPAELLPSFRILASDIDRTALAAAKEGVYTLREVESLPPGYLHRHLVAEGPDRFSVHPELRALVRFNSQNLHDPAGWPHGQSHAIFCRNVIIYFGREAQERVVRAFCDRLPEGGFLFLGHSEGLPPSLHPLDYLGPSTYRRRAPGKEAR